MLTVFVCVDRSDGAVIRQRTRAEHIRYMMDRLTDQVFGGPLLDDAGRTIGSLICMNCRDRTDAERFLAQEPYFRAGLFERVEMFACRQMVPEPVSGFIQAQLDMELRTNTSNQ